MIQIRNVPDDLHRKLKVRAAEQGLTLSDYLLAMAERESGRLTTKELAARIRRRGRVDIPTGMIEQLLHEGRAERGA
jgi:plasmid stability protein